MSDYNGDGMRMTAREWFAARVVLIGGFIIAIAVAGYFTWQQHEQAQQAAAAQQAEEKAEAAPTPAQAAQIQATESLLVCVRFAVNAENAGILPSYARLASRQPAPTTMQGRYTCNAVTDVAKYTVTADLLCADMRKADCAKIYSITSNDGKLLYRAQE